MPCPAYPFLEEQLAAQDTRLPFYRTEETEWSCFKDDDQLLCRAVPRNPLLASIGCPRVLWLYKCLYFGIGNMLVVSIFMHCWSHKVDCCMRHGICTDQCYLCKQPCWTTSNGWPGSHGICMHDLPQRLQQNLNYVLECFVFTFSRKYWHFIWHLSLHISSSEALRCGHCRTSVCFIRWGQRCTAWSTWALTLSWLIAFYPGSGKFVWTAFWPRIYDYVPRVGNPKYYQCLLDEDFIRRVSWHLLVSQKTLEMVSTFLLGKLAATFKVKAIVLRLHPLLFSKRALQHYAVAVCLRWAKGINA